MNHLYVQRIKHPMSNLTLFAESLPDGEIRLVEVRFGIHKKYQNRNALLSENSTLKKYSETITGYLDGRIKDLSAIQISLDGYTEFQKQVLRTARSISRGKTVSYSELAKMSGFPKAVRAVASVMRNNRFPLVIPCHRVIKKGGAVGGFAGQMKGSKVDLKRRLLESEKLTVNG